MSNFSFLKSLDKNLYEIISDAEKLYRDEYFEQCIGQTRRFAENVCKQVLGSARTTEKTLENNFLGVYKDLDREDKRRFWRTLLKEIHVEGTNVVSVEFNC